MKTSDIVSSAIELVAKGWTQGALARDKEGKDCYPCTLEACEWCVVGAIERAVCYLGCDDRYALIQGISSSFFRYVSQWEKRRFKNPQAAAWNDLEGRTQEEVIYALCGFRDMLDSDPERNELGYWSARGLRPGARFDS